MLVQLTSTGWQLVVNGQLIPYASGVLGDQLAAQTILSNTDTATLKGAQFCLGYGTSAGDMIASGKIQLIGTIPNSSSTSTAMGTCLLTLTPDAGIWWNRNEAGRGFSIEAQGNALFLGAFLYDSSGRSTWYASGGGIQSDGTYLGTLQSYGNGQTLTGVYKAPTVTNANAGNVTLTFTDATHGTLTWPGGSTAIERFVFDSGTTGFRPETGMWWNETEAGADLSSRSRGAPCGWAGTCTIAWEIRSGIPPRVP